MIQVLGGHAVVDVPGRMVGTKKERREAVAICSVTDVRPMQEVDLLGDAGAGREDAPRLEAGIEEIRRIQAGTPSVWAQRLPPGESGPCGVCGTEVTVRTTLTGTRLACGSEERVRMGGKASTLHLSEYGVVVVATPVKRAKADKAEEDRPEDDAVRAWPLHECQEG